MKFAQVPMGMDTMPMAAPAGAPPGGAPGEGQAQPTFKVIYSPLDSIGKILADLDFKTYVQNHFGDDADALAHKIWVMYGGAEDEVSTGKTGLRQDKPQAQDPTQAEQIQSAEYNATRNSRWERLPAGVSIDEITNTRAISQALTGGWEMLSRANSKPAEAKALAWLKLAEAADDKGLFKLADKIIVEQVIKQCSPI